MKCPLVNIKENHSLRRRSLFQISTFVLEMIHLEDSDARQQASMAGESQQTTLCTLSDIRG